MYTIYSRVVVVADMHSPPTVLLDCGAASRNLQFEVNSWVWLPDEKEMYLPAKVVKPFKPGEEGDVKMEDGKVCAFALRVLRS